MVSMVKFDRKIDAIVIKLVHYRFCCTHDTEYGNPKASSNISSGRDFYSIANILTSQQ